MDSAASVALFSCSPPFGSSVFLYDAIQKGTTVLFLFFHIFQYACRQLHKLARLRPRKHASMKFSSSRHVPLFETLWHTNRKKSVEWTNEQSITAHRFYARWAMTNLRIIPPEMVVTENEVHDMKYEFQQFPYIVSEEKFLPLAEEETELPPLTEKERSLLSSLIDNFPSFL